MKKGFIVIDKNGIVAACSTSTKALEVFNAMRLKGLRVSWLAAPCDLTSIRIAMDLCAFNCEDDVADMCHINEFFYEEEEEEE